MRDTQHIWLRETRKHPYVLYDVRCFAEVVIQLVHSYYMVFGLCQVYESFSQLFKMIQK